MIDDLLSRVSLPDFGEPGPDEDALKQILASAVRAPDHGKLSPWRFLVIRGEARNQLSDLFAEMLLRREPEATEAQVQKERGKPLRSPVTIALVAKVAVGHKIPAIEQIMSGAAAAMNILNAAHMLGFGGKWVTGANCYDPCFLQEFGLEATDQLLGFIHLGSVRTRPNIVRPDAAQFTEEWRRKALPDR